METLWMLLLFLVVAGASQHKSESTIMLQIGKQLAADSEIDKQNTHRRSFKEGAPAQLLE
ncbi:hypothetical protein Ciccas_001655 [Cichlidogyrus casuarinus]|uniref:Uncharacterized protein n=1 Tax=Cichlidogyrus casuarinus TaxID=1844966 RepID=A0ABD2QJI4_9PLAT